jgi:O-acetyl-ADP-ribose deacetylase (regulator of RNase III)
MPRIIESELSIFDVGAEVLVNPVNCVGVMGAGLAKDFAWRYPDMLNHYKLVCKEKKLKIGTIHTWSSGKLCVVNLPTKNFWKDRSEYSAIDTGMRELVKFLLKNDYRKIAIPRIGCGLGGLEWGTVKSIVLRHAEVLSDDFTVFLFEAKNV